MLFGHFFAFVASCMVQMAFIPICTFTSSLFGINNLMISMCSLVFSIAFIPFNFVAIKVLGSPWGGLRVCVST